MLRILISYPLILGLLSCYEGRDGPPAPLPNDGHSGEEVVQKPTRDLPPPAPEENPKSGTLDLPPLVTTDDDSEKFVATQGGAIPPLNQYILWAIKTMPRGGGYSVSREALSGLKRSVVSDQSAGAFRMVPKTAQPSFCSGATYLVFLRAIDQLVARGSLKITPEQGIEYAKIGQADGVGLWGRWNANGPGTAGLFAELGCGSNFSDYQKALPGDFMKIWWTEEIGSKERGHSVIYLGTTVEDGEEMIRFWSSNVPDGYGEKVIPKSKAIRVLFSRLDNHRSLAKIDKLPAKSQFLADMLTKQFTWDQVVKECKVR